VHATHTLFAHFVSAGSVHCASVVHGQPASGHVASTPESFGVTIPFASTVPVASMVPTLASAVPGRTHVFVAVSQT
jgi:hypothetical protein